MSEQNQTPNIPEKFLSPYDPSTVESSIYKQWEESGYFNPDNLPGNRDKKYSIIMPPPNANGRLHAGHGTDLTIKDILVRFKRMQGYKTLLLPGSDHAGFETQGVFEKKLKKEGRSRFGMERKDLYNEIYDFVMENKHLMEDDIKKMGMSCDWSRNTFTLQPDVVSRVEDTFIKMFNDGLIYRGKRSIHWNPKFQTSLSEIETKFEQKDGEFYYFQFGPFVIGTSRPETKFRDKYIVMHPDDARYAEYKHMQEIEVEWINGPITATIIKDEVADPELGTGVMTITPWHSQVDFELAQKYDLDYEQIIGWDSKLLPVAGEFAGIKIAMARPMIVEKLDKMGLLVKTDKEYKHSVRLCERTGAIVEPQIKDQWFIKMDTLAKSTLTSLENNEYSFVTEQHEKIFKHWMNNPMDWNISRQIVWGIQIPAWFKKDESGAILEIKVSKEKPADSGEWEQDPDTFDTWFSSGQWPLMTLGYPEGKDMEYYPTDVMEAGSDLVFKWIPRMIMFGLYLTGKAPFREIYFHGMVLDGKGVKMSKSKGNVLSLVGLGEEFGTDATRMSFIIANPPGANMPLSKDKVRAYKKFANKIWNITRFVLTSIADTELSLNEEYQLADSHKKHIELFDNAAKSITKHIDEYRLHLGAEEMYHYVWHTFADESLEACKQDLSSEDAAIVLSAQRTLLLLLKGSLKIAHPFMPFITEEIWQSIPHDKDDHDTMLMISAWPTSL